MADKIVQQRVRLWSAERRYPVPKLRSIDNIWTNVHVLWVQWQGKTKLGGTKK